MGFPKCRIDKYERFYVTDPDVATATRRANVFPKGWKAWGFFKEHELIGISSIRESELPAFVDLPHRLLHFL